MAKTAQAKTEVTNVVSSIVDDRPEWLEKGNRGSEGVSQKDMILPRIDVLQALSPQVKKSDPAHIDGAEQGLIFNTVSGKLYGSTVTIVPVLFRKEWAIWKLRTEGGGFRGAFSSEEAAEEELANLEDGNKCEIVETHQHFVMVIDNDNKVEEAVVSMTKSKIKVSRALNTLVATAGVDRFAKAYELEAVETTSDKGDFWTLRAKPLGFVTKEIYQKGEELYNIIKAGGADVDRTHQDDASSSSGGPVVG